MENTEKRNQLKKCLFYVSLFICSFFVCFILLKICYTTLEHYEYAIYTETNKVEKENKRIKADNEAKQNTIEELDLAITQYKNENESLQSEITETERLINESRTIANSKLYQEKENALSILQSDIIYVLSSYCDLGLQMGNFNQREDIETVIKQNVMNEVISKITPDLEFGGSTLEQASATIISDIIEGKNIKQIKDDVMSQGADWISNEILSKVGEKILGHTVLSVINSAKNIDTDKEELNALINLLLQKIDNDFFACYYKVLSLDEWNDRLYWECYRKTNELCTLIEDIEIITKKDFGYWIWYSLKYDITKAAEKYYGLGSIFDANGELME